MTPSAVSQHIAALQRQTGLDLFDRVGRGHRCRRLRPSTHRPGRDGCCNPMASTRMTMSRTCDDGRLTGWCWATSVGWLDAAAEASCARCSRIPGPRRRTRPHRGGRSLDDPGHRCRDGPRREHRRPGYRKVTADRGPLRSRPPRAPRFASTRGDPHRPQKVRLGEIIDSFAPGHADHARGVPRPGIHPRFTRPGAGTTTAPSGSSRPVSGSPCFHDCGAHHPGRVVRVRIPTPGAPTRGDGREGGVRNAVAIESSTCSSGSARHHHANAWVQRS